jgi:3''-phosphoadenosine 5''-phosphosulfate sulfotransferase (PAPS reductase)/FAD synthetase and related enzymes
MKYIASCSFGKDSLAAIHCRAERGERIDGAVYCRIMFDAETSAELPEHEEWIHEHAIPLLKSRYGIDTAVVQGPYTYVDYFYRVVEKKTKNQGRMWGFPFLRGPWCNSRLKVRPMNAWRKIQGECTQIVGIAADETKRIERSTVKGKILPLVDYGIVEAEAAEICRKTDLLSPAYNGDRQRLGCWFCHNQRLGELRRLRTEHPALWGKLMALDKDSPVTFKPPPRRGYPGVTVRDLDTRFFYETAQISIFERIESQ